MDTLEKLKEMKELLDQDVITEAEFQQIKSQLLDEMVGEDSRKEAEATPQKVTPKAKAAPVSPAPTGERASTGMKVLSFLIPIAGLILFFMDREKKPEAAKEELMWAGIGFGVGLIGSFILMAIGASSSGYYY